MSKPEGKGEPVSLYYALAFDEDWYLLTALASNQCKANLRTSGGAMLYDHPLPKMEGKGSKGWTYAMFIGKFYADEQGWQGRYEGVWTEWRGR